MKQIRNIVLIGLLLITGACNKYLDVVPDNIATIETAFTLRSTAERYLFTCYSYLPKHANLNSNPGLMGADELVKYRDLNTPQFIGKGLQNVVDPYVNYWDGAQSGTALFRAIRDCNIFIDNIQKVAEMSQNERDRWAAEAKFLKAYYHFWLFRMYGPIPLIKENLPVSTGVEDVKVYRASVDECVSYIAQLLDEAVPHLPPTIQNQVDEMGRATQSIALSIKAQLLVTAASPLFNGNQDYKNFKDNRGAQLFNPVYDAQKWQTALDACNAAITSCHNAGLTLYYYNYEEPATTPASISQETRVKMNIRNSFNKMWSSELIWANNNSKFDQRDAMPRFETVLPSSQLGSELAVSLNMVELYYTDKGVPIKEALDWDYSKRLNLRVGKDIPSERNYVKSNYTTVELHFNREPRFYANIAFDGGIWFGQGKLVEPGSWYVQSRAGQPSGRLNNTKYSISGYWPKKLVSPLSAYTTSTFSRFEHPWPIIRLSDLYLLYAEAANEVNGPGADAYQYIDQVRTRAGLEGVVASWGSYSTNPNKPTTKEGLREIIQQERSIELAFEGQRFWDLRRWKKAQTALNQPVLGWDVEESEPLAFYRPTVIFNQTFKIRDYFWPIKELDIIVNKNLAQNPGW